MPTKHQKRVATRSKFHTGNTGEVQNGRVHYPKVKPGAVDKARAKGEPCPSCGLDHVRKNDGKYTCVGHNDFGYPCGQLPIPGGTVCKRRHGGGNPVIANAAAKRIAFMEVEGEVAKLIKQVDLPDQHPIDGLLEVVRHAGGMFRMLGLLTGQLDTEVSTQWRTDYGPGDSKQEVRWTDSEAIFGYNHEGDQAVDVRVQLYEKWATLYMRACKTALDADIDERMVRNATATSERYFKALEAGLAAAADLITPAARSALINGVANYLRGTEPVGALEGRV